MAFDSNKYKSEFAKQNYDRFLVSVPKGKQAVIQAYAKSQGISVNQCIIHALETLYHLDLSK